MDIDKNNLLFVEIKHLIQTEDMDIWNYKNELITLIDEAIARQTVKSEDVTEVIKRFEKRNNRLKEVQDNGDAGCVDIETWEKYQSFIEDNNLAITALQAYQLPSAIKWTGDNLREVINLIGWNESASSRWTWEEYEQIVKKKGLKIFTPDGSVITEVGSWIVRDGKYCHALQAYQPKESCTIEFDDPEYFVGECSNCEYEIDPDYGWSYCPGCGRRIE